MTPVSRARRTDLTRRHGRPDGVISRQQYVRCGKQRCQRCPPHGPGHGPYWYGSSWDYRQRTTSFSVGTRLPPGVTLIDPTPSPEEAAPTSTTEGGKAEHST